MPLVRRENSVLIVVEEGPERNGHTDPGILARVPYWTPTIEKPTFDLTACPEAVEAIRVTARNTAANSAVEHERGLIRMTGAGVERNHCKGVTFEWLHTVDRALETFPEAAARGTPPRRL